MSHGAKSTDQGQRVTELLEKCAHYDKDERYMATNDLCNELIKGLAMDEPLEQRICTAILKQLDDQSNDVQAVAVKCLGVLFKRIHLVQVEKIAVKLCKHILQGNDSLRDIYAIGLKTLLADIPEDLGVNVAERMATQLLNGISDKKTSVEVKRECIDILSELLKRFGTFVQGDHERIMNVLLAQLQEARPLIKKRSSICLGSLSLVLSDELLDLMVKITLQQIAKAEAEKPSGYMLTIRTLIHTIGTISRCVGRRLRSHLGVTIPLFLRFCGRPSDQEEDNEDFDEMAENCFSGVESFISTCPVRDITPFLSSILEVALMFLSYDPNFCCEEDEDSAEGMDIDGGDGEYSDYGDMDEDIGEEDDDHSWKVRKAATRVITAMIRHGEFASDLTLIGGTNSVGDLLINRFRERVENVRLDVIECFSALIRRFSANALSDETPADAMSTIDVVDAAPTTSVTVADTAESAHIQFFSSHTAVIAKKCKLLFAANRKGSASADDAKTRVAALGVIRLLTMAMQGHVNLLIPDLIDALRACLSDPQQAVKLEAVVCLRRLFETHTSNFRSELQQLISALLPAIEVLVNEEWYKLTIEGLRYNDFNDSIIRVIIYKRPIYSHIRLYGVFITTLRPIVSSESTFGYVEYSTTCGVSDHTVKQLVQTIHVSVLPHVSAQDNDQEVRDSGLAVIGSLLAHFGDLLLSEPSICNEIFSLLLKRVENEVTRMAAMRALIQVTSSSVASSFAANSDLVSVSVFSTVTRLLGQQDRSLRQTALRLLNALVCMHAAGSTGGSDRNPLYDNLLQELIVLMTDADLFICNLVVCVARNVVLRYYPITPKSVGSVHSVLLNRAVTLMSSPLISESVGSELRALMCELAKGGHDDGSNSPLVNIVSQLITSTIENAANSSNAGHVVASTPLTSRLSGGTGVVSTSSRGAMINAAMSVASVVLAAHTVSTTVPITVSQLCDRMLVMVTNGTDPLAEQLIAKGAIKEGKSVQEICIQFGLLTLGSIGQNIDVSSLIVGSAEGPNVGVLLFDTAFGLLEHLSEDIKSAASFCIGNLSTGNADSCFQRLISAITSNVVLDAPQDDAVAVQRMRTQHLLLSSLKIVISCRQTTGSAGRLIDSILHPCLVAFCTCSDESVRSVVADCVGALMESHCDIVIPVLLDIVNRSGAVASMLSDDARFARALWTVATALRHGLSKRAPDAAAFLCKSRATTDVFFGALFQTGETFDLEVRKAALLLLNTLLSHNKDVIAPYMTPTAHVFLSLKASLTFKRVYKVDLGPYKLEVDDGIPLRKTALTCLETILLAMPARFSAAEMMEGLLLQLNDKDGMIKLQTYQVLSRTFSLDSTAFSLCDMDKLIKPLEKVIFSDAVIGKGEAKPSTGDNNVRPLELMRGALQVVLSVGTDSLLLAPANQKAWAALNDKIMGTPEIISVVEQTRQEMKK